ncbi:hypothetical protein [Borrelia sp. P9F1]|uniref:hypothetical protein n=1 Tax=Borrelia sp. P9F1 TaxID=3058374 RepID=UPI00264A4DCA|nr:hypothetical protein [Borrelia sp. P9F1]WKC58718.1 hypothetical protein QYZ68_05805 [Borrelia sp. P9F1]
MRRRQQGKFFCVSIILLSSILSCNLSARDEFGRVTGESNTVSETDVVSSSFKRPIAGGKGTRKVTNESVRSSSTRRSSSRSTTGSASVKVNTQ